MSAERKLEAIEIPWEATYRPPGVWRSTLRFIRQKPLGSFGAVVLLLMVIMAIFAPVIATHDPYTQDARAVLASPSAQHLFGTDNLGRDVFSRVVYGSRISMTVGLLSVAFGIGVGVIVGLISGYRGGWIDMLIQRIVDALMSFPILVLAMAVVAVLGPSLRNVTLAIGVVTIPLVARVVRGSVLSVKENLYIEAARTLGASGLRIAVFHILPNVFAPIIVLATVRLGVAILTEASLSFLGIGTPPPQPSWGEMLSQRGRLYFEVAPWMALFPGLAITLAVLGINFFGDALRDVLDPRLRGVQ